MFNRSWSRWHDTMTTWRTALMQKLLQMASIRRARQLLRETAEDWVTAERLRRTRKKWFFISAVFDSSLNMFVCLVWILYSDVFNVAVMSLSFFLVLIVDQRQNEFQCGVISWTLQTGFDHMILFLMNGFKLWFQTYSSNRIFYVLSVKPWSEYKV